MDAEVTAVVLSRLSRDWRAADGSRPLVAKLSPDRTAAAMIGADGALYIAKLQAQGADDSMVRFDTGDAETFVRCEWLTHNTAEEPACSLVALSASNQLYLIFMSSPVAAGLATPLQWKEVMYKSYQNILSERTTSIAEFALPDVAGHYLCFQLSFVLPTIFKQNWPATAALTLLGVTLDGIVVGVGMTDVVLLQLWRADRSQQSIDVAVILHHLDVMESCSLSRVDSKQMPRSICVGGTIIFVLLSDGRLVLLNAAGQLLADLPTSTWRRPGFLPVSIVADAYGTVVTATDAAGTILVLNLADHVVAHPETVPLLATLPTIHATPVRARNATTIPAATPNMWNADDEEEEDDNAGGNGYAGVNNNDDEDDVDEDAYANDTSRSSADSGRRRSPSKATTASSAYTSGSAKPGWNDNLASWRALGPLSFTQPACIPLTLTPLSISFAQSSRSQAEAGRLALADVLKDPQLPAYAHRYVQQVLLHSPAWIMQRQPSAKPFLACITNEHWTKQSPSGVGVLPRVVAVHNGDNIVCALPDGQLVAVWLLRDDKDAESTTAVALTPLPQDEILLQTEAETTPSVGMYVLRAKDGVVVRLRGVTQQHLLTNVIMFENPTAADMLCASNGWNRRLLAMRALHLGLAHRQLDVLVEALSNLQADQHLEASRLCLAAVRRSGSGLAGISASADDIAADLPINDDDGPSKGLTGAQSEYTSQLTQITTAFVTRHLRLLMAELLATLRGDQEQDAPPVVDSLADLDAEASTTLLSALEPVTHQLSTSAKQHCATIAKEVSLLTNVLSTLRKYLPAPLQPASGATPSSKRSKEAVTIVSSAVGRALQPFEFSDFPVDSKTASIFAKWSNMDSLKIVDDALRRGCLSLALAYFKKENLLSIGSDSAPSTRGNSVTLAALRPQAYSLIFSAVRRQKLDQAVQMLLNIGANVSSSLREIFLYTVDTKLRAYLMEDLRRRRELTEGDLSAAAFIANLESVLTSESFSQEVQRLAETALRHGRSSILSVASSAAVMTPLATSDISDSDESMPTPLQVLTTTPQMPARLAVTGPLVARDDLAQSKYLQVPFAWILDADQMTRDKLLLDAFGPAAVTGEASVALGAMRTVSYAAKWAYAAAHAIVASAENWIVDEPKTVSGGQPSVAALQSSLDTVAAPFVADIFTHLLVAAGLWHPLAVQPPDTLTIEQRAHQAVLLARAHRLLSWQLPGSPSLAPVQQQTAMPLPEESSLFHRFFVRFAVEQDLPRLLLMYLDRHQLLTTAEQVHELLTSLSTEANPDATWSASTLPPPPTPTTPAGGNMPALEMPTVASAQAWLPMLLYFRLLAQEELRATAPSAAEEWSIRVKQLLRDASTASTAFTMGALSAPTGQRGALNAVVVRGRPLLAIATLLLASVPIQVAASPQAPPAWSLSGRRLHSALDTYPVLQAALALVDDNEMSSSSLGKLFRRRRASPESTAESLALQVTRRLSRGVLGTDVSLYDLLQVGFESVDLRRVLGWQIIRSSDKEQTIVSSPSKMPAAAAAPSPAGNRNVSMLTVAIANAATAPQVQRESSMAENGLDDFVDFSSFAQMLVPGTAFDDRLDALHHLSHGRPLKAVTLAQAVGVQMGSDSDARPSSKSSSLGAPLNQTRFRKQFQDPVGRMAAAHFDDPRIVSACLTFLDLNNVPTAAFRANLAVARRLYQYRLHLRDQARTPTVAGTPKSPASATATSDAVIHEELVNLVLRLSESSLFASAATAPQAPTPRASPGSAAPSLALQVRDELEAATVTLLASSNATGLQRWLPWDLVAAFCRAHSLSPSRRMLEQAATQHDAFTLLWAAEQNNYPPAVVLRVVEEHLGSAPVSEHLRGAILEASSATAADPTASFGSRQSNAAPASFGSQSTGGLLLVSSPTILSDDLFDVFSTCVRGPTPSRSLLLRSLYDQRPFFAVLGAAVAASPNFNGNTDVTLLECFCVWLYASCPRQLKFLDMLAPRERVGLSPMKGSSVSASATASPSLSSLPDRPFVEWRRWSLSDLSAMAVALCQSRTQKVLLDGWLLFDPASPLVYFLRFQECFLRADFGAAEEALHRFVRDLATMPDEETGRGRSGSMDSMYSVSFSTASLAQPTQTIHFGDSRWIRNIVEKVLLELLSQSPTPYERRHLIETVVRSGLDPRYRKMLRTLSVIEAASVDVAITIEPAALVDVLVERQLFDLAREFAAENGFPPHEVTLKEVNYHVAEFHKSSLWEMEFTRMAMWSRCHALFRERSCDSEIAGEFFLRTADEIVFKDNHFAERAMVLALALQWFNGTFAEPPPVLDTTAPPAPAVALRPRAFLEELQKRLWLVTISAESSAASKKAGAEATEIAQELGMQIKGADLANILATWLPGFNVTSTGLLGLEGLVRDGADDDSGEKMGSIVDGMQPQLPSAATLVSTLFEPLVDLERQLLPAPATEAAGGAILRNELEVQSLNLALGRLLNAGMVRHAVALAVQFKHISQDLSIVHNAIQLAEGRIQPINLPSSLNFALEGVDVNNSSGATVQAVLDKLAAQTPHAGDCARRVASLAEVSRVLDMTYTNLVTRQPFDVLSLLLLRGRDILRAVRNYIVYNRLDGMRVARLVASSLLRALMDAHEAGALPGASGDGGSSMPQNRSLYVPEAAPSQGGSPLTADPSWSPSEFIPYANLAGDAALLGQALLELVLRPISDPRGGVSSLAAVAGESTTTTASGSPATTVTAAAVATGTAPLSSSPASSGASAPATPVSSASAAQPIPPGQHRRTPSLAFERVATPPISTPPQTAPSKPISAFIEVEILVRAHYCFGLVSQTEGLDRVLAVARERVDSYVSEGRFGLLIRLLSAFRRYREMEYIFDALVRYDMFELVLRKALDKDGQTDLKLALHDYLQRHHPADTERLTMVYLHFNMFREIGDTLHESSQRQLRAMKDKAVGANYDDLLRVMQLFGDAAESYLKEDCVTQASRCLSMANLVALQLQTPSARLINLNESEVRRMMASLPRYSDARILAEAYERDTTAEWVHAVYAQSVQAGNVAFAEQHNLVARPTLPFFHDLVGRFRADASAQRAGAASVTNLRRVVELCPDVLYVYRVAVEFKFNDLIERLAADIPGVDELAPMYAGKDALGLQNVRQ